VCAEWAKTYAHANHFDEEVELVIEEMRRACRYFTWWGSWWQQRERVQTIGGQNSLLIQAGQLAYARKQASILEQLSAKFLTLWQVELSQISFSSSLLDENLS
jgi:hypothetical protein